MPLIMVDSGNSISTGPQSNYYRTYKNMVDAEMRRAAKAEISGTFWREYNHFRYEVTLKNISGVDLSSQNDATINAIVYEDVTPTTNKYLTSRVVRAVVNNPINGPLADGDSATYTLQTLDIAGVDWTKLHSIIYAEYRPGGTAGAYDMLQAAVPVEPWFAVQPETLKFLVDAACPQDQTKSVQMLASPQEAWWYANDDVDWLTTDPVWNQAGTPLNVHLSVAGMTMGSYTGSISVSANAGGKSFTQTIPVVVTFTNVKLTFLPMIQLEGPGAPLFTR